MPVSIIDYPLESLEFHLFSRIVTYAGWNGEICSETIKQFEQRITGASYRMCEYALKLLVAARVVEQVCETRQGKTYRVGWRPLPLSQWVAPAELSNLRQNIYTNRKPTRDAPLSVPNNVVALPVSTAIPVPAPGSDFMTEQMTDYIEAKCPLVAVSIIAKLHQFYNHHSKPKFNRVSNQSEIPHHTLEQWREMFLGWMDNANAMAAQSQGITQMAQNKPKQKLRREVYDWERTA